MNSKLLTTGTLLAAFVASSALAETSTPPPLNFNLTVGKGNNAWVDQNGTPINGSSMFAYSGQSRAGAGSMSYLLEVDPDPFIGFSYEFFNNSAVTQIFTVTMTLPVGAWNLGSVIGASIGGSVTDANFDGVGTLSTLLGTPLFDGKVDGTSWLSLFNDPFSVSVPFTGGTQIIGPGTSGLPGPSNPGPGIVSTDMSITLTFQLTPGDRASFTGIFVLEYIPSPASAIAFLGLAVLRRRRTA